MNACLLREVWWSHPRFVSLEVNIYKINLKTPIKYIVRVWSYGHMVSLVNNSLTLQWCYISSMVSQITSQLHCLYNNSTDYSNLRIIGPMWEYTGDHWFPSQRTSNEERVPRSWCLHEYIIHIVAADQAKRGRFYLRAIICWNVLDYLCSTIYWSNLL